MTPRPLLYAALAALACSSASTSAPDKAPIIVPPVEREFRAAWVATVANIDWPSKPGLSSAQQQAEMIAILEKASQLNLNAIVLQVRPACDALYPSKYEPWSEFLTGAMGKAPEPLYDPLEFAVSEAHRRGIELHAWFNPYRARHFVSTSPISADHISRTQPELAKQYGRYLWLDPGEPRVQEHSLNVMLDVVRRYDLDGVHIDDYFYPYKEKDAAGNLIEFPDEPSWRRYQSAGGKLSRDDWRRENVDSFIERLYRGIKREKKWVKFGISPFGIWRPGHPPQIQGFDQYAELYADARKWLREGWVDYWTPQLYWPIAQTPQSYPVLLGWWAGENVHGRHLWPGNFTSRLLNGGTPSWSAEEIQGQIYVTRGQPGASGNVHFSMKALMQNSGGVSDLLSRKPAANVQAGAYAEPALVPASPWLDGRAPGRPSVTAGGGRLSWKPSGSEPVWLWAVQLRSEGRWRTVVLPAAVTEYALPSASPGVDAIAVSAVDRCGNQSRPVADGIAGR